ncbi:MAG: class II aldolase/adducin family protein [Sporomusaceae bacterium]|jgi:L-fuculose-phosphate aldolase|nr:class II aldolase/adducin family protein [Sporomusaceae bacterium]
MNKIKEEVLAFSRQANAKGLCHDTVGNFSIAQREGGYFIITPSGKARASCHADDMCALDFNGQELACRYKPSIETLMHLKIYQTLPEVAAIVHVHSPHATAFAAANKEITGQLEEIEKLGGRVPLAVYAQAGTEELADNALKCLLHFPAVLLANHGLVTVGKDMTEAFLRALIVEDVAKTLIFARMLGMA